MKLKTLLKYILIWQTLITAVVVLSARILPLRLSDVFLGGGITEYLKNPLLNFRSNFDGVHYILIATHGYNFGQQAFFPLYPDLIKLFFNYIRDPIMVGTAISLTAFFIMSFFLYKLIRLDYSDSVARWTLIILLCFPTSFYFGAVYSESLFLLFTVLAFYSARKDKWLLAGIFGCLASYTRLVGVFLFPALLFDFMYLKGFSPGVIGRIFKALPLILIPAGLLTYMYFLYKTTGDPLAFYHVQSAFLQERSLHIILPYQVFWRYLKMIVTVSQSDFLYLTVWLEFIIGMVFLLLCVLSLFRQRLSYFFFSVVAFLLPTLTGTFVSLPRYVLTCFPLFILLAQTFDKHPKVRLIYLGLSVFISVVFLSLYARGYWVS